MYLSSSTEPNSRRSHSASIQKDSEDFLADLLSRTAQRPMLTNRHPEQGGEDDD
jgi:hypothetical protein